MASVHHDHLEDYVNGTGIDTGGYDHHDYCPTIAGLFLVCIGAVVITHLVGFKGMVAVGKSS